MIRRIPRRMQTVIAMDGLGRALQTAKQGERRDSLGGTRSVGWNLSGAVAYDGNGRVIQEGQPQFASGTDLARPCGDEEPHNQELRRAGQGDPASAA